MKDDNQSEPMPLWEKIELEKLLKDDDDEIQCEETVRLRYIEEDNAEFEQEAIRLLKEIEIIDPNDRW